MGRDFEFCGQRQDNGEWVYGSLIERGETNFILSFPVDVKSSGIYAVKSETIGRAIGICDKCGNELYINDIVRTKYGRECVITWFVSQSALALGLNPLETDHPFPD